MNYRFLLILLAYGFAGKTYAQDYSAIHGSSYFGSLDVYNNPSSILGTPYKWDLTLTGLQYQTITNAVRGPNFPLILSPSGNFYAANGNYKRDVDAGFNVRFLNFRYSLNNRHAFAFGLNFRGYVNGNTSTINYTDSVIGPRTFLSLNTENGNISANAATSTWMELYGTYAITVKDDAVSTLNAGASLKIMKGMAGGFGKVNNVGVERVTTPGEPTVYKILAGDATYGYSDNLGDFENVSAGDFLSGTGTGFAFDVGVEYVIKSQAVANFYDEMPLTDYDWKIGVSLLDLGWNNYAYSNQSRSISTLKPEISSTTLTEKFASVRSIDTFNDSLATIVENSETLTGKFSISNPARAVVNVDLYLSGNFYVNGELSINLSSGKGDKAAVAGSKLLTVTPRWEKRTLGFYLPVQYNRHGNFWIGGAVKAGPLLFGTHNLLNIFSKNKYIGGGAYLAIIIRPMNFIRDARLKQYECPEM